MAAEAEAALQGALIVLVVGATLPLPIARTVMSMQITTVITITATSEFTLTPIIITIVIVIAIVVVIAIATIICIIGIIAPTRIIGGKVLGSMNA